MAFTFKLQTRDGMPADPPTLLTVAPLCSARLDASFGD